MRILLFGKNGQVGWELQRTLAPLGEVIAVDFPEIDFQDFLGLRKYTLEIKPNLIVNAAAYTAVDQAETESEIAKRINGEAPRVLAEIALTLDAGLVHYSTDYVFDGTKGAPYTEEDEPNPINVYGQTKLAGDHAIQGSDCAHLILRTSWVYGARGKNFFLTMLRLAREREEIRIVDDQIGCPTWSRSIAQVTAEILLQGFYAEQDRLGWGEDIPSGVYNYSSSGSTSWYGFAEEIIRTDPNREEHIVQRLLPISTEAFGAPATRPAYSQLSKDRLGSVFKMSPEGWREQLESCWQSKDPIQ
jgi:dTDP-4-dehydrorhamnose reductase